MFPGSSVLCDGVCQWRRPDVSDSAMWKVQGASRSVSIYQLVHYCKVPTVLTDWRHTTDLCISVNCSTFVGCSTRYILCLPALMNAEHLTNAILLYCKQYPLCCYQNSGSQRFSMKGHNLSKYLSWLRTIYDLCIKYLFYPDSIYCPCILDHFICYIIIGGESSKNNFPYLQVLWSRDSSWYSVSSFIGSHLQRSQTGQHHVRSGISQWSIQNHFQNLFWLGWTYQDCRLWHV